MCFCAIVRKYSDNELRFLRLISFKASFSFLVILKEITLGNCVLKLSFVIIKASGMLLGKCFLEFYPDP